MKKKKKRYTVYGYATASITIGEYEAEDAMEACDMAADDKKGRHKISLCYQCSRNVDVSDVYDTEAIENE